MNKFIILYFFLLKKNKHLLFFNVFFFLKTGNILQKYRTNTNTSTLVEQMTTKEIMILKELGKITL